MELSDIFFAGLYGLSFILIIHFIISLVHRPQQSNIVISDETHGYQNTVLNSFAGSYNHWPYWTGGYNNGNNGGYNNGARPYGGHSRSANRGI